MSAELVPVGQLSQAGSAREGDDRQRAGWLFVVLWAVNIGMAAAILFLGLPKLTVGTVTMFLLLGLILVGVPVGYSMLIASIVCLTALGGLQLASASLTGIIFESVANWQYSVIPMFVMMGVALWTSGLSGRTYGAARQWLSWLPGGLGVATNFAGAGLAAASGSTMGIVMTLGKVALPEMMKRRYSPALATGSVAMAGTLGQVIPPSILLVVYAGVAETPVGPQLLAGLIPGLILALGFATVIVCWALIVPSAAPRLLDRSITWRSRLTSLIPVIPVLLVVFLVIGGMFTGIFTATEAAAVGAVAALLVGVFCRGKGTRSLPKIGRYIWNTAQEAVRSIAGLFLVLLGAVLLTSAIARSGIAQSLSTWLVSLEPDRVTLMFGLILFYLVLGMFLESLPMILLTVPILIAPLEAVGVDMIWFGVFVIIMCEIGMVFPPIGIVTFIVHRLAQDPRTNSGVPVSLVAVFKGVLPFVALATAALIVFVYFPEIVLWLPNSSASE